MLLETAIFSWVNTNQYHKFLDNCQVGEIDITLCCITDTASSNRASSIRVSGVWSGGTARRLHGMARILFRLRTMC